MICGRVLGVSGSCVGCLLLWKLINIPTGNHRQWILKSFKCVCFALKLYIQRAIIVGKNLAKRLADITDAFLKYTDDHLQCQVGIRCGPVRRPAGPDDSLAGPIHSSRVTIDEQN